METAVEVSVEIADTSPLASIGVAEAVPIARPQNGAGELRLTIDGRQYRHDSRGRFAKLQDGTVETKASRPLLLPGVDGRNEWARRARDSYNEHVADMGGADNISAAERSILRRAAVLATELERLEVRFALAGEAEATDLDLYQRTAANLRRLLEAVGLQRRAKPVLGLYDKLELKRQERERAAKQEAVTAVVEGEAT
jgi:hypothetical protein